MRLVKMLSLSIVMNLAFWGLAQARELEIVGVHWQGSGCDFQNVAVTLSPDGQDLSFLFDEYGIELSPQDPRPSLRKDCLIYLDFKTAPGIQFAFRSVDYRGFAAIPAGMEGFHRLAALLQGERVPTLKENYLRGPMEQNYFSRFQASRLAFSPCNQTYHRVLVYSQLGLNRFRGVRPQSAAMIVLDSKDFSATQNLGIELRRCY